MITEAHTKENLSRSYVQAVAAKAGVNVVLNGRSHDYGFDGTFHQVSLIGGKLAESGTSIDFQLKSSIRPTVFDDYISYELEAHTYNALAARIAKPRATPALLILLLLPKDNSSWLSLCEEQLILRNCCYWEEMPAQMTPNQRSVTIKIPRTQLLTPSGLQELLDRVEKTGKIKL